MWKGSKRYETVGAFILTAAAAEGSRTWPWRRPHAAGSAAPPPGRLRLLAAHYLLGCRYWCMNMLSSLSIQPPLFLQRNGDFFSSNS